MRVKLGLLLLSLAIVAAALSGSSGGSAVAAPAAPAGITALDEPLGGVEGHADGACHTSWRPGAPGVVGREVPVPAQLQELTVALGGADGDWDVAVFDSTNEAVVASAETGATESASGFTGEGGLLRVQACRLDGDDTAVPVRLTRTPIVGDADALRADPPQIARVYVPTDADRNLLLGMGMDMTEHGGIDTLGVVLHGAEDRARLRNAGLKFDVLVKDLVAQSVRERRQEFRDAARAGASRALPSGRTGTYRTLADYNAEMKKLAEENPGVVRLFTMPNKTLLGKEVMGVEIAEDVTAEDGRPAFFNMGVHHAREWPAGEMPMEWAYELVNGYKSGDARATKIVKQSRNIIVPIVNPDGFQASRSAGQLGGASGGRNEAVPDTAYILGGAAVGGEYRRKNCRLPDDSDTANCLTSPGAVAENGVDPNRNYGGLWGGPGAETTPNGLTYRGQGPFSEPETQNIQHVVSTNQVMSLITNHTTAGLVLRAPGLAELGDPVDENKGYKALGDDMAKENGYFSQKSFELYDTTGTTEDWSYNATGGFGFTFEIYCGAPNFETGDCDAPSFHPTYAVGVEQEWSGDSPQANHVDDPGPDKGYDGKGNREAYYIAAESAINRNRHSVLEGTAPAGATLRLTKTFKTQTFPQPQESGDPKPIEFDDKLESVYKVGSNGKFEWHVNPSTRPIVAKDRPAPEGPPSPPIEDLDGAAGPDPRPCPGYYPPVDGLPQVGVDPTCWADHPFTFPVGGGVDNESANVRLEFLPSDDFDLEIYEDVDGDGVSEPEAGEKLVANSGNGATNQELGYEEATLQAPAATTKYVARVVNFAAVGSYDGTVNFTGPLPGQQAKTEAWTLTCEIGGATRVTRQIVIERGERKTPDLSACGAASGPGQNPGGGGGNGNGGNGNGGNGPNGGGNGPVKGCKPAKGFLSTKVTPQGRGLRFAFKRRVERPVTIDVFSTTQGEKVTGKRRVARFKNRARSFTWSGAGAKGDGVYFVRLRVKGRNGVTDVRVHTFERENGVFERRGSHFRTASCRLLQAFKLSSPAFGGASERPLQIGFRLGRPAQVTVIVERRGGAVVKTFAPASRKAKRNYKLKVPAADLLAGDYVVTLIAKRGTETVRARLSARRF